MYTMNLSESKKYNESDKLHFIVSRLDLYA